MLGSLVNSGAIVVGALVGGLFGRKLPEGVKQSLPLTFGMVAVGLGAVLASKAHALPAVALATLLGALIGELLGLERRLGAGVDWMRQKAQALLSGGGAHAEGFVTRYVTLLVLFCASGMGVFGAIQEGMTGNPEVLLAKSALDLFTAMIFAAELGLSVALIAIPQFAVQGLLFLAAAYLIPSLPVAASGDFSACGGIIMIATGLRMSGIRQFPIVNMLPALALAFPCSLLWGRVFG